MKIALIGYGKMGHEIEKIAVARGHEVVLTIDVDTYDKLTPENLAGVDVAIEFTMPESAVNNYKKCFASKVPVVSGTTGWLDKRAEVEQCCKENDTAFFYASNFSLGANLFFELNRVLAKLMQPFDQYRPEITEVHHTQKLDKPSGTAISLAEDMIKLMPSLNGWVNDVDPKANEVEIHSVREGAVPGIHAIKYDSEVDFIEITHSAKSRKGLAFGAVLAAEYTAGKKGLYSMSDLLNLK